MQTITEAELLDRIKAFLARHDMAPTTFGRNATGEPQLIRSIENGRSPSLAVTNRVLDYMARIDAEAETRRKLTADFELNSSPPPEEETELPFRLAPVNPTGAISPISSPTSARRSPSAANGCSRSTAEAHDAEAQIPSCSADEDETAGPLPLVTGQTRAQRRTPGAPPVLSKSSFASPPSTPTVAGDA